MKARITFLVVLAAALLATAHMPAAQSATDQFPQIRVGETVTGRLSTDDPSLSHRGSFKVYRFQAEAGDRLVADMRSGAFDAYLTLMRPVGGITEILQEDDDGGDGTDARLRFRADHPGTYLLVAQALGQGSSGSFTLTLAERPPPAPVVAQAIRVGQSVDGRLHEGSAVYETEWDAEIFFDLYSIQASAGDHLIIDMMSSDADSFLEFGPLDGNEITVTEFDDDGGEYRDARLRLVVPEDGTYGIRARTFGEGQTGSYTLSVGVWEPQPAVVQPISAGPVYQGTLTDQDAMEDDGAYYQDWIYQGRAGERVHIRMRSDDFDTYLSLGQMEAGVFVDLISNDDAPDDGTNSLVEYTLPSGGEYVIRTSALFSGSTGDYTVQVESD
jgi:hypothetical protein